MTAIHIKVLFNLVLIQTLWECTMIYLCFVMTSLVSIITVSEDFDFIFVNCIFPFVFAFGKV